MPARRRSAAISHRDGEPITRADIQYDLLSYIFADQTKVFSDPESGSTKLSFCDLYLNAILRSPKAKSVLKEKLALPTFATDFAMLALLTNVGRIATTMSCMSAETCSIHD
jgi:Ino eighty subunit 1